MVINKKAVFFRKLKRVLSWVIIVLLWVVWIGLIVGCFVWPYLVFFWLFGFPIVTIILWINHARFQNYGADNIIVFGGKRKGKGLMFQKLINHEVSCLANIPYAPHCEVVSPVTYFESIAPNTMLSFLNDVVVKTKKVDRWEKQNYYMDDGALYVSSSMDSELKKRFPTLPLFFTTQGHLYDSTTKINVQNIERIWKTIRELQVDGFIKARFTTGKGFIFSHLPILRKGFIVSWRYYENIDSAINGLLPFEKLGMLNTMTSSVYTTTASALKAMYEGQNGKIKDGFIWVSKKEITYDTRYYETVFLEKEEKSILEDIDETVNSEGFGKAESIRRLESIAARIKNTKQTKKDGDKKK